MDRRNPTADSTRREITGLARKKMLVDSRKCVQRSRELVKGSKVLIEASRKLQSYKRTD